MSARTAARARLLEASLRVISGAYSTHIGPHTDAEAEYSDEQLALAARELTEATDALPPDEQPVGWSRED